MTIEEFKKQYGDVWNSFSDFTRDWLSKKDRLSEPLEIVNGEAKRHLDNEKTKPMPKSQAAKEGRLKRLNDLEELVQDLTKALKKAGISGKYRVLDNSWSP